MREKLCYRSLIMEALPTEIADKILAQKMNCTQAHGFLSQYFLKKDKTEEDINREEEVWTRVGEIHFPNEGVSSSSTFADLCSKRNPLLSDALDGIIQTIFECVDFIYNDYNDEETLEREDVDMSIFEDFETLKINYGIYTEIKGYSPRRFIADYQDSLHQLVTDVCYFTQEHEDYHETIAVSEQTGNYKISKFIEMFRHNSNLFVGSEEPLFESNETEPEKLKRKIWSQYTEIPEFVTDVYDLLRKPEDSIYVSHLYLTGQWIDEVTLSSETLINSVSLRLDENDQEFIDILPFIGKLVMTYVDGSDLNDSEWLNETTLEMEQDELLSLKQHFREGTFETTIDGIEIPYFTTNYLEGFSAQEWADILVEGRAPPWCFDEQTLTGDNATESFVLSIRYKFLTDWFNNS